MENDVCILTNSRSKKRLADADYTNWMAAAPPNLIGYRVVVVHLYKIREISEGIESQLELLRLAKKPCILLISDGSAPEIPGRLLPGLKIDVLTSKLEHTRISYVTETIKEMYGEQGGSLATFFGDDFKPTSWVTHAKNIATSGEILGWTVASSERKGINHEALAILLDNKERFNLKDRRNTRETKNRWRNVRFEESLKLIVTIAILAAMAFSLRYQRKWSNERTLEKGGGVLLQKFELTANTLFNNIVNQSPREILSPAKLLKASPKMEGPEIVARLSLYGNLGKYSEEQDAIDLLLEAGAFAREISLYNVSSIYSSILILHDRGQYSQAGIRAGHFLAVVGKLPPEEVAKVSDRKMSNARMYQTILDEVTIFDGSALQHALLSNALGRKDTVFPVDTSSGEAARELTRYSKVAKKANSLPVVADQILLWRALKSEATKLTEPLIEFNILNLSIGSISDWRAYEMAKTFIAKHEESHLRDDALKYVVLLAIATSNREGFDIHFDQLRRDYSATESAHQLRFRLKEWVQKAAINRDVDQRLFNSVYEAASRDSVITLADLTSGGVISEGDLASLKFLLRFQLPKDSEDYYEATSRDLLWHLTREHWHQKQGRNFIAKDGDSVRTIARQFGESIGRVATSPLDSPDEMLSPGSEVHFKDRFTAVAGLGWVGDYPGVVNNVLLTDEQLVLPDQILEAVIADDSFYLAEQGVFQTGIPRLLAEILFVAADYDCPRVAESIITEIENVNTRSQIGETPLIVTARRGSTATMNILLTAGADITEKNQLGETAWDVASAHQQVTAMNILRRWNNGEVTKGYERIEDAATFVNLGVRIAGFVCPPIRYIK